MRKEDVRVFPKLSPSEIDEFYTVNDRDLNRCTPRQRAYIRGLMEKANIDEYELICSLGLDCEKLKEFTIENASEAIDYLKDELGWN